METAELNDEALRDIELDPKVEAELRDAALKELAADPSASSTVLAARAVARLRIAQQAAKVEELLGRERLKEYWRIADDLVSKWLGAMDPFACSKVMPDGSIVDGFEERVREITLRAHEAAARIVYDIRREAA